MDVIWPNPLLATNPIAYQMNVMARGVSFYGSGVAAGGGPGPGPGPAALSITEPAVLAFSSGVAENANYVEAVSPSGNVGDLLLAVQVADSNEALYSEDYTGEWQKLPQGKWGAQVAASVASYYMIAPSGQGQHLRLDTGGTTEGMGLVIMRISGVDNNNPFYYDTRWRAEDTSYSGLNARYNAFTSDALRATEPTPIHQRNMLAVCIDGWDQHRVPADESPTNGWQYVINNHYFNSTHGVSLSILTKLYDENSGNWMPNEFYDEEEVGGNIDTHAVGTLLLNPSGSYIRPGPLVTDYPEMLWWDVEDNNNGSNMSSGTMQFPSGIQNGDVLYMMIFSDGDMDQSYVHDTQAGYWHKEGHINNGSTYSIGIFTRACLGGETGEIVYRQLGSEQFDKLLVHMSGVDMARRIDVSGFQVLSNTVMHYPEITTSKDNCRIFAIQGNDGASMTQQGNYYNYNFFQHGSVSGIYSKRAGGGSTEWNLGTWVQPTAGTIPSGTWKSSTARNGIVMHLAIPPESGAVNSEPFIVGSSLSVQSPNGSWTGVMPTETPEEGDIYLLIISSQSSIAYVDGNMTTQADDYGWKLAGASEGSSNTNIGVYYRKANPGETPGNIVNTLSDTHTGLMLLVRGAEGIGFTQMWNNDGAVTSSATIPSGLVTHDKSLVLFAGSLGDGTKNITGWDDGTLTELIRERSGSAAFDNVLSVASKVYDAGNHPAQTFNVDSADEALAGLAITIKPKVPQTS